METEHDGDIDGIEAQVISVQQHDEPQGAICQREPNVAGGRHVQVTNGGGPALFLPMPTGASEPSPPLALAFVSTGRMLSSPTVAMTQGVSQQVDACWQHRMTESKD